MELKAAANNGKLVKKVAALTILGRQLNDNQT